jgi:hypothetical protein
MINDDKSHVVMRRFRRFLSFFVFADDKRLCAADGERDATKRRNFRKTRLEKRGIVCSISVCGFC